MPSEPYRFRASGDRATDMTNKSAEDSFRFLTAENEARKAKAAEDAAKILGLENQIAAFKANIEDVEATFTMPTIFPTWITFPFSAGWSTHVDGNFGRTGYRMWPNGMVEMRGLVTRGAVTLSSQIGVLPAGYHPDSNMMFACVASDGLLKLGEVRILQDGQVILDNVQTFAGTLVHLSLSNIHFQAGGSGGTPTVKPTPFAAPFPLSIPRTKTFIPIAVSIAAVVDLSDGTFSNIGSANLSWQVIVGTLFIYAIYGLQPGRQYRVKFRLEGAPL